MDIIRPLQKALYKAPEQFEEVRALVGEALMAAKETAKQELDSIQLGADLGETLAKAATVYAVVRGGENSCGEYVYCLGVFTSQELAEAASARDKYSNEWVVLPVTLDVPVLKP
jgi:urease accessory protein UreF